MELATSSTGRLYFHQFFPVIGASSNIFQNNLDTISCSGMILLGQMPFCDAFQPVPSWDSVTLVQNWDLPHTQPGHRQGTATSLGVLVQHRSAEKAKAHGEFQNGKTEALMGDFNSRQWW